RQRVGALHERLAIERNRLDPGARIWSPDHGIEDVLTVTGDWCGRPPDLSCVAAMAKIDACELPIRLFETDGQVFLRNSHITQAEPRARNRVRARRSRCDPLSDVFGAQALRP